MEIVPTKQDVLDIEDILMKTLEEGGDAFLKRTARACQAMQDHVTTVRSANNVLAGGRDVSKGQKQDALLDIQAAMNAVMSIAKEQSAPYLERSSASINSRIESEDRDELILEGSLPSDIAIWLTIAEQTRIAQIVMMETCAAIGQAPNGDPFTVASGTGDQPYPEDHDAGDGG